MIEVRKITKRFATTTVIDCLSFYVNRGEILGFLGPNGAGKTTTMRILANIFIPTSGTVIINGFNIIEKPIEARREIGYLPENIPLYLEMRVKEFLFFVASAKSFKSSNIKAEVDRVIDLMGIKGQERQIIKKLSRGFRQRVGLAQAIIGDPPILFLDEPSIGLDPKQIIEIRSIIKSFSNEKTVILSSHILSEVAAICSRVIIINHGKLVAEGPLNILNPNVGNHQQVRLVGVGNPDDLKRVISDLPIVVRMVEDVTLSIPERGITVLILDLKGGREICVEVVKAVIDAGLGVIEITPINVSLEEVFVQLTN